MARRDENKTADEQKTAGTAGDKDVQTTDEAVKEKEQVGTAPTEAGETDAKGAASGNVVGGVVDGEGGFASSEDEDFEGYDADEVEGAVGVVRERSYDGSDYEVPFAYLTSDHLPRTSDSDDAAKDWTAQHAGGEREDEDGNALDPVALTEVVGTPGQTFRVSELPNVEVMREAGIDVENWLAGLPIRPDVPDEAPRRGIPA